MRRPSCFSVSWDPDADACLTCPVQRDCLKATIESARASGLVAVEQLLARGMAARAADVVAHAVARLVGPAGPPKPATPPPPTFERWQHERDTRPLIAQLQPGDELRRVWRRREHVVRCEFGFWAYAGARYPTLASVVVAIAGPRQYPKAVRRDGRRLAGTRPGAICSATRFFRLGRRVASDGTADRPAR